MDDSKAYFDETSLEQEREHLDEMAEHARAAMANVRVEDSHFFQRLDTRNIVTTEVEYEALAAAGVPMRVVDYRQASHVMRVQEAKSVQKVKRRAAAKRARASRKRAR